MIWQRALASIFPSTGSERNTLGVCRGFCEASTSLKFPGLKLLGTDMCDEKIEIARKGEYPWYSLKAEIVSCSGFCKIGRDFYISTGSQGILNAFWYMYVQFFFLFFLIFFVGGFVLMQLSLRVKSRMSICQLSGTALGLACTLAKMFNSTSIAHHHIGCFAMSDQLCPPSHRNLNWGGILSNLVYLNPWKTGRTWTTWQLFFLQLLHLGSSQLFTGPRERWGTRQVFSNTGVPERTRWIKMYPITMEFATSQTSGIYIIFDDIIICVMGIRSVTMAIWCNLFRPSQSSRTLGGCQGFCWAGWGSTSAVEVLLQRWSEVNYWDLLSSRWLFKDFRESKAIWSW